MIRLIALLIITSLQTGSVGGGESRRFRFVLPEGFNNWVCIDLGVAGAPALTQDQQGIFEIIAEKGIASTSSLPHYTQPLVPTDAVQIVDGKTRHLDVLATQSRDEYDFKSPISRHCLFFGSDKEAQRVGRPPTLAESAIAGRVENEQFEFQRGTLCDLKDEPRFCVDARDETRADVAKILVGVLRKEPGRRVTTKCSLPFHGIVIRYEGHFSAMTHSRQHGPRYGWGEVQRSQATTGAVAQAFWMSDEPGTATEVVSRFSRDLELLFEQVKSASCRQ